ncbi:MAG: hypothetical protein KC505_11275 [Myxococcales bacterium]|nr:hypothetical protein [Myxococcales bacterium]
MKIPSTIFPTQTILVDDDSLYGGLLAKNMECEYKCAIESMSKLDLTEDVNQKDILFLNDNTWTIDNGIFKENLSWKNSCDSFEMAGCISVVVADLYMPKCNGLQLLEEIESPFVYKILISNHVIDNLDHQIKQALNDKTIHASIDKRDKNFKRELSKQIRLGKQRFFGKISDFINNSKDASIKASDPEVSRLFWNILENKDFSFLESDRSLRKFKVKDENRKDIRHIFIDDDQTTTELLSSYQGQIAPNSVKEKLKSSKFILSCDNPYEVSGETWGEYLVPAKKVEGRTKNFLISVVERDFYDE